MTKFETFRKFQNWSKPWINLLHVKWYRFLVRKIDMVRKWGNDKSMKQLQKNYVFVKTVVPEYFYLQKALRVLPAETRSTIYRRFESQCLGRRKTICESFSAIRFVLDGLKVHHDTLRYLGMYRLMWYEDYMKYKSSDVWLSKILCYENFKSKQNSEQSKSIQKHDSDVHNSFLGIVEFLKKPSSFISKMFFPLNLCWFYLNFKNMIFR